MAIRFSHPYALLVCFLVAGACGACEQPDPPVPPASGTQLSVIAPADGAALEADALAFHWTSQQAGGFHFRLYAQGTLLADEATDEDHFFYNAMLFPNQLYTWELRQGSTTLTQTFTIISSLLPFLGSHPGRTYYSESEFGTWATYDDTLHLTEPSKVSALLSQGSGATEGIISGFSLNGEININFGLGNGSAHLEINPADSAITFDITRQINSRGDYESYNFSTL